MSIITRRVAVLAVAVVVAACTPSREDADAAAIAALMHATWDRPEAPLSAGPIAVHGVYAVADWTQGEMGGRALLVRRGAGWVVSLCSGDGIGTAAGLRGVGVPPADAAVLAADLARLERAVATARLRAMSQFQGLVRMDQEDTQAPRQAHAPPL